MIRAKVHESSTLALLQKVRELKAAGKDIVSFAAGESDFPTPPLVLDKAIEAARGGDTRYVASAGIPELREAVAADYRERMRAPWVKAGNVVACFGAKQGIYLALASVLDVGDEVLIPKPYWVSYPSVVEAAYGKSVIVATTAETNFFPTIDALEKARTPRTKALIFSSPSNPTGAMIDPKELQKIVEWCVKQKVTLIYDEIYERLTFGEIRHATALEFGGEAASEYVIAVNACSKSMAMTGWRMGYLLSHKDNVPALVAMQSQMVTCVPGFIQQAAAVGLKRANEYLPPVVEAFKKRRDFFFNGLKDVPHTKAFFPQGAFYIPLNVEEVCKRRGFKDDAEFATKLLEEALVALTPGGAFGMPGWVRLSFATSEQEIQRGLDRLKKFCSV